MYNITKVGALQLAARYDAIVRYNLIQRLFYFWSIFQNHETKLS